jgi:hypothetical protein
VIESPATISIIHRIINLIRQHETEASYRTHHLYLGKDEYSELCLHGLHHQVAFPLVSLYQQGTIQFLGKNIFVLKDVPSHLALA